MTKTRIFLVVALTLVAGTGAFMAGYNYGRSPQAPAPTPAHTHQWGQWGDPVPNSSPRIDSAFIQFRHCTNCGVAEYRHVDSGQ